MDNLQFFNAQVGIVSGSADFWDGSLSITFYSSLVVTDFKFNSIPSKIEEGILVILIQDTI